MISQQTGMPQLLCRGIFEYLIAAIYKLHKLKIQVNVENLPFTKIPLTFIYSENDRIISPHHTKVLYENFQG